MEYDYTGELSGAVTADGEEVTRDGETISTETVDQNVGLVQNGGSLTLTGEGSALAREMKGIVVEKLGAISGSLDEGKVATFYDVFHELADQLEDI